MQLLKRWRLGRGVVGIGAGLLLIAGLAMPAAAVSQTVHMTVVGGQLRLSNSTGTNSLGGSPQCSNTSDDEWPGDPQDGLIDYPADTDCETPFDNSERDAGFQAAVPISLRGTIDDVTGAFSIPTSGLSWPLTTLYLTTPLPGFVVNTTTADSAITGTIDPSTGATSVTSANFNFRTQVCLTAGASCSSGNPPAPYGSGTTWTVDCNVDVNPASMSSSEPSVHAAEVGPPPQPADVPGSHYNAAAGVVTVANNDFGIPTPTDAGTVGVTQAFPCAAFGPAFGFPTTGGSANASRFAIQLSTNKAIAQARSITLGNGAAYEAAAPGKTKITFPVTVFPAPTGTDLTFTYNAVGITATEKVLATTPNPDFNKVDAKVGKVKIGKTQGKLVVTVLNDLLPEADEFLVMTLSAPTGGGGAYTIVHGTALGTIKDVTGANLVSVLGGDTPEGSAPPVAGKPAKLNATFPVVLSTTQGTDTTIAYCTQQVTALANSGTGLSTVYRDYAPVSCATPKLKVIKAGKQSTSIAVPINQDTSVEPDEVVIVQIVSVTGSGASANPAASLGIGRIMTDD